MFPFNQHKQQKPQFNIRESFGTEGARRKSLLEALGEDDLERSKDKRRRHSKSNAQESKLLGLPSEVRCKIWKRVGNKTIRSLRLTCSKILEDIDHKLGISAEIDDEEEPFEEFYQNVAIRHATVTRLMDTSLIQFLMHPELLTDLSIHGPISTPYFKYFMRTCHNIRTLSIVFTKPMLKYRPSLFPQLFHKCLINLHALRFVAHTKKEKDLIYISDNLKELISETLDRNQGGMTDIHVSLSHHNPSPYLQELVMEIIVFAHKNSSTLQDLHLNVKEPTVTSEAGAQKEDEEEEEPGSSRRGTGQVQLSNPSSHQSSQPSSSGTSHTTSMQLSSFKSYTDNFDQDRKNSLFMEEAERYLNTMTWGKLPYLRKVNISVGGQHFKYLVGMFAQAPHLLSLQLEINGGIVTNSWLTYQKIINFTYANLTVIKLLNVSFEDFNGTPLDIDFSIFRKCKKLKAINVSCKKNEIDLLPRIRNVTKIPSSVETLEIGWGLLSAWQVFRLLYFQRKLQKLCLSYTCYTDSTFGWFLTVIRLLISCGCTRVQLVVVKDFKIKFRNKRAAVKKLTKSVPVQIEYHDREETMLIIDRGQARRSISLLSIPSQQ